MALVDQYSLRNGSFSTVDVPLKEIDEPVKVNSEQSSIQLSNRRSTDSSREIKRSNTYPSHVVDLIESQQSHRATAKRDSYRHEIGNPVDKGHPNYLLMFDMLTGIRISVSRCNAKPERDVIVPDDYSASHKLAFDSKGTELTPKSEYDFKFKGIYRLTR